MALNIWPDPGMENNVAPTNVGSPATSERSNAAGAFGNLLLEGCH